MIHLLLLDIWQPTKYTGLGFKSGSRLLRKDIREWPLAEICEKSSLRYLMKGYNSIKGTPGFQLFHANSLVKEVGSREERKRERSLV